MSLATASPARDLEGAPRASPVDPDLIAAADLAEAHAPRHLVLPPYRVVWCDLPGGPAGDMPLKGTGARTIRLNVAGPPSPHAMAFTALHELQHASEWLAGLLDTPVDDRAYDDAQRRADAFAGAVMRHPEFAVLSRRPSRSPLKGVAVDYREYIEAGGVSGNIRGARAEELLRRHRALQADARRAVPLQAGEVECGKCHGAGFRIALGRFRCRECGMILDLMGAALA
jgi:hypothetical protein